MTNKHMYHRPPWAVTPLDVFDHSREQLKTLFSDSPETFDFIVRAVVAHEELLLAAKDALLMLKDLSDSMYVRPEMFRNAKPVDRLFKAIALAEGRPE